jgi:magnesium-transporting ATPase (P-type)
MAAPDAPPCWHCLDAAAALAAVRSTATGLTGAEARARLATSGPNRLPSAPPPSLLGIGLRQLKSPLIYVLLAAAAVALALGDYADAAFIGVVLLVNSALGGWQEWQAEQQSRGLQKLLRVRATVLRDGAAIELDAEDLVPGDIVAIESGQRIPADVRLLDDHGLEAEEALLTGESLPVAKSAAWRGEIQTALGDRANMLFAGSTVARGRGRGVVVATGTATEIGRLAITLSATEGGTPPLIDRMQRFSRTIAVVVLAAAVFVGAFGVLVNGQDIATMFMFGVALAVSAIPEGLPVAVTVTLAIAARRMAARGAIVRRLPAVEGLGSCTLIASDKTGTLTCNELTVREIRVASAGVFEVSGAGYAPHGSIVPRNGSIEDGPALQRALEIAIACNDADLHHREDAWTWRGDPTDIALLALAAKRGVDRDKLLRRLPRIDEIPFEADRRYAASFHEFGDCTWVAVKGAPERVLEMCELTAGERAEARAAAEEMAARGLRVIALAGGELPRRHDRSRPPREPAGLGFAALVGLIDPLRPGAREAVGRCAEAGIRVIMVTGDHPVTALAIARDLGIASTPGEVVAGTDLAAGSPDDYRAAVQRATVFARVAPDQKLRIVEAAQQAGHFVAVTGDGVNDAPALRRANIGVAMGRGGTDVAREAAGLVLSDDNFATIVNGVEEGRVAYRNIRNVVYLLIAAGVAEVLTVGLAVLAGLPLPLLPVQLLWLNLVTNGIQDVALAFERGQGDELRTPPRRPGESLFDRLMVERGLLAGLWMAGIGIASFVGMLEAGVAVPEARNHLLLLMVLMQNVDAFNARSETRSVFSLPFRNNPLLAVGVAVALSLHLVAMHVPLTQRVLDLGPLDTVEWTVLPLLALSLLAVMELHKLGWRWRRRRTPG